MADNLIIERVSDGVVMVRLNRPERNNAISLALLAELVEALDELRADESLRALVVTGSDPSFCAGLDLFELAEGVEFSAAALDGLRSFPVPVIGAINGAAITGGLELALACDFRIASERAMFADTHSLVGVVPAWGMSARLPQLVGQSWARQMSFTGAFIDAETSCRIGLVNTVVPHRDLLATALGEAEAICATNAPTLRLLRNLYDIARDKSGEEALDMERRLSAAGLAMDSPEDFAARRDRVIQRGRRLKGS